MHPGSITPLLRAMLRRAFEAGAFGDLDVVRFEKQVREVSAHSTRVEVNQDTSLLERTLEGSWMLCAGRVRACRYSITAILQPSRAQREGFWVGEVGCTGDKFCPFVVCIAEPSMDGHLSSIGRW